MNRTLSACSRDSHDTETTPSGHEDALRRLREARAQALAHYTLALQFSAERRALLTGLIAAGFSQADLARELGVSRQAIGKMLTL